MIYSRAPLAPAQAPPARRWFVPALALLFFGSGVSALVYQVLWTRVLGWTFGVTIYAASAVWASFMAGLAIGSQVAGRFADRIRRPLRWFGAAEILVGLTALASPILLQWMQRAYVALYPSLPHSTTALTLVRLAMAFGLLIVPTVLMGATLPLVIKSSVFEDRRLGHHLGLLYGSNTTGAIVGTLTAGLLFIPTYGIHSTFLFAASLNVVVGAVAVLLSALDGRTQAEETADPAAEPASRTADRRLLLVLIVFTLSGFVSLALEVVWFRVLTLFLRPTVYGFAVMLATILAGIALGSYLLTPFLDRPRKWIATIAVVECAVALASALSFWPLASLPALSDGLTPTLAHVMPEYLVFPLSGSLIAIFPTAVLMGAAFPMGLRVWAGADGESRSAGRIGTFYSLNVAGAIAGSLVAGFVLLPLVGSRAAVALLSAMTLLSGFALLAVSEISGRTKIGLGTIAAGAFAAVVLASPDPFQQFIDYRFRGDRIVWREEGVEATVVVHESQSRDLSMTINGNHQAGTDGATAYVHRRIGHLPMAIHPDPRTALVIGLGGGATAGAVSVHGASIDVVELAAPVVRAARLFAGIDYGVSTVPTCVFESTMGGTT